MKHFSDLYMKLDGTTKVTPKVEALKVFFERAHSKDKLWLIALFTGKRPKRILKTSLIKDWIMELSEVPEWLFTHSYHIVGDLAETISLLLPAKKQTQDKELYEIIQDLLILKTKTESEKKAYVLDQWGSFNQHQSFIFNKLITGGFRLGVSQKIVVKALAEHLNKEESAVAHRLMGNWSPLETTFEKLLLGQDPNDDISRPYPFYLAYGLEAKVESLGPVDQWVAEKKWDGIRGQIIKRKHELFIWSRGEELVTEKFPELHNLNHTLMADCVLDGEILAFRDGKPMNFHSLQTRMGRKNLSKTILDKTPVHFFAYDLLEINGKDLRSEPLVNRRLILTNLVADCKSSTLHFSKSIHFDSWTQLKKIRAKSRQEHCEGLMLKKANASYQIGRKKGDWWKWKLDPLTVDAVLIYAMRGHGRRANLYTDYTFAVWNDQKQLITFTKAYSGLTDSELKEVDRFVKKNTIDRFGPVRSVKPELVFEIGFEGIAESRRHKSGLALRFPRILRWRRDKSSANANTLADLHKLLNLYG